MVKNYIYFNENGKIKKHTIGDLYAGSHLVDAIYLFADFTSVSINNKATMMFRRSDGQLIGEVECMPDNANHPVTGELVNCFSFVLGSDVLGVPGPLQITARYYDYYPRVGETEEEEHIRANALVTANVYESVPIAGGQNAIINNLNRRVTNINNELESHINEFNFHDHNGSYYQKIESDKLYANHLEVDLEGNLRLISKDNTLLANVKVPTVIQTTPPGTLVFNGIGEFIIEEDKRYLVSVIGSPTINLGVFLGVKGAGMNEDEVVYDYSGYPMESIYTNFTIEFTDISNFYEDVNTSFVVDTIYKLNGITKVKKGEFLPPIDWPTFQTIGRTKIGLHSLGYYQVYRLDS